MDNLPSFHVVNTIKAQLEAAKQTATNPHKPAKVGHREFFWLGEQLHVVVWFGRSGYTLPCTEEQAIALARNHAHVTGQSTGRNRKILKIVMGSGR